MFCKSISSIILLTKKEKEKEYIAPWILQLNVANINDGVKISNIRMMVVSSHD